MTEPIHDPNYWKRRLEQAQTGHLHHSIFKCPLERWQAIEARHRQILAETVKDDDSILDCGCGYGRLLTLLPVAWTGFYYGIDLSPDFVDLARQKYPDRSFEATDLKESLLSLRMSGTTKFNLAVMISVRPMVIRNEGQASWDQMERQIKAYSDRQLYLEYDPEDGGELR